MRRCRYGKITPHGKRFAHERNFVPGQRDSTADADNELEKSLNSKISTGHNGENQAYDCDKAKTPGARNAEG